MPITRLAASELERILGNPLGSSPRSALLDTKQLLDVHSFFLCNEKVTALRQFRQTLEATDG
ncbi:hypothetical protein Sjap_025031 [Stephania japonica]|uniref:Uncharacterized protein n=1 Tax=Stephania japonica TaxID=461633 RepID=A0AAP0E3M5_9MAGN